MSIGIISWHPVIWSSDSHAMKASAAGAATAPVSSGA
jgi:hypothetical protein